MCTAVTFHTNHHYFGRNLDLEYSYQESVTITPRNYPFRFRQAPAMLHHHAIIGMAYVQGDYPLYYDAVNEQGLAMAGLNFPGNARYFPAAEGKDNITPFEFIPWILGQCGTVAETRPLLERLNLLDQAFAPALPLSPLHWILADREEAIVIESMADGLHIHENPVGVLTNNPPFDFMLQSLATYRDLSPEPSVNRFAPGLELPVYCQGLGAVGLPGDWSSVSRFVRAAFVRGNSLCGPTEQESVSQFFHILSSVEMPRGCVRLGGGKQDITVYSSCCNQDTGVYYYTTYENPAITAVSLHAEKLEGDGLVSYPLQVGNVQKIK